MKAHQTIKPQDHVKPSGFWSLESLRVVTPQSSCQRPIPWELLNGSRDAAPLGNIVQYATASRIGSKPSRNALWLGKEGSKFDAASIGNNVQCGFNEYLGRDKQDDGGYF